MHWRMDRSVLRKRRSFFRSGQSGSGVPAESAFIVSVAESCEPVATFRGVALDVPQPIAALQSLRPAPAKQHGSRQHRNAEMDYAPDDGCTARR
jgi:hypothetical protein